MLNVGFPQRLNHKKEYQCEVNALTSTSTTPVYNSVLAGSPGLRKPCPINRTRCYLLENVHETVGLNIAH